MSTQQLLARLINELPAPERVEPFAFLEDERLPPTVTLVEAAAFVLAYVQAAWGPSTTRSCGHACTRSARRLHSRLF